MEYKVEKFLIVTLWIGALISYSIALLLGYDLFDSDIIGMIGILILTLSFLIFKKVIFYILFAVLFIGMLNIASFVYFINLNVTFGFLGKKLAPGIQLYSFILMAIFITLRKPKVLELFNSILGQPDYNNENVYKQRLRYFKTKFKNLSDYELNEKLEFSDLVKPAKDALIEIRNERDELKRNSFIKTIN